MVIKKRRKEKGERRKEKAERSEIPIGASGDKGERKMHKIHFFKFGYFLVIWIIKSDCRLRVMY
jgi:hypothetical protein